MSHSPAILITVSGPDSPGITSALTKVLSDSQAKILDIGQSVIHGLLSLSILFESKEGGHNTLKELLFKSTEMGLKMDFKLIQSQETKNAPKTRYAITLIGDDISASALHEVTEVLAQTTTNIDTIERLSQSDFGCVQMLLSSETPINQSDLRKKLLEIARIQKVDIALQTEGLFRRAKRLVVMDMDSTLIQNEVIDEMAKHLGVYDEVASVTEKAMNGAMDFDESLKLRVSKLKGMKESDTHEVFQKLKLTSGAEDLIRVLKKLGYKIALISGGFSIVADQFKEKLGIDYAYANQLEMINGICTGNVIPPIVNAQRKSDLLEVIAQQENIHLNQVIAIGDGANDLQMLEKAGLGIAFNAKPVVSQQADLSYNQKNLKSILYLLGIPSHEQSELL
ncbi:MAG: phosphoserine phosphatase SerB [Bdellovibrionaceae bacterium]|nr:phosphoserine phosphatase SerB [Pseudobdellovibrionaceae bacterium]|tara:strand:- start:4969 stop:6153 length:1185 start_codon:yes stop_codon:yes gene_type:complete